ncbi:DNA helicase [Helicobacter anseris]|uniref:DNA helicase n=1 Tax=Helicobacter anseris TaxID=375926 RepID=A0A3D8J6V4_9HELI|nr:AAA domain-containing protein [Helicobacter anseris]RDU72846.1 DNA helicase [Helicobacter anseris]
MDTLEYLKEIADIVGNFNTETTIDKENTNILSYFYSEISSPRNLLDNYCNQVLPQPINEIDEIPIIYPFGFNISQKYAVNNAITNPISIIQGPPGTGKTQTILNIIANAILRDCNVAAVSNNNSAIQNIEEKLQKYSLDFFVAKLGNYSNKTAFIENQKQIPNIKDWHCSKKEWEKHIRNLKKIYQDLDKKLLQQNQLSLLKQNLTSIKIEKQHFEDYCALNKAKTKINLLNQIKHSNTLLKLLLFFEFFDDKKSSNFKIKTLYILSFLTFWNKEKNLFYKLLIKNPRIKIDTLIARVKNRFYALKYMEVSNEIKNLEQKLKKFDFKSKMQESTDLSMKIFYAKLHQKYSSQQRKHYKIEDLKSQANSFLQDYPLVLSTTHSIFSSLSKEISYDYLIIDEASQVDLCTGSLALNCAKKAVIVGDLKQLPNIVSSDVYEEIKKISDDLKIKDFYRYEKHSFLSSMIALFPQIPMTLLKEHYRCHPKIINFCNQKFYENQLVIMTEETNTKPLMLFKAPKGNHARDRVNQRQIDMIVKDIIPNYNLNTDDGSLGIISPYRNQVKALQEYFKDKNVKIDTVDKFQGQENKVIILSTVGNHNSDFIDNANRLNVAISRAIEQLIIIINDDESFLNTGNIGDLVRYIQYHNFDIKESKIYSIFDLLYQCYHQARQEFLKKYKKISLYDSENLIYALLSDILKDFPHLGIATHIPLKMILRDTSLLDTEEKSFALHRNTHVDFLIFNHIDKKPRLIIEVDGVAFHQTDSIQAKRDCLKEKILKKYNLDILRLRTNESEEKTKILDFLQERKL